MVGWGGRRENAFPKYQSHVCCLTINVAKVCRDAYVCMLPGKHHTSSNVQSQCTIIPMLKGTQCTKGTNEQPPYFAKGMDIPLPKVMDIRPPKGIRFDPQKHEYFNSQNLRIPSVSEIIRYSGESTDYSMVPPHILQRAAEIGQEVHRVVESHVKSGTILASEHSGATKYMPALRKFFSLNVFEPVYSELKLIHEEYGYAGTVDLVGWMNGEAAIVDVKTTNLLNEKLVALQTAAYAELVENCDRNYDRIFRRYALHLDRAGTFKLHRFSDPLDFPDFLSALDRWQKTQ